MKPPSTHDNFGKFFWTAGLAALLVLAAVVSLNYAVDPYFIHQWDTPLLKRLSPAQQKIMPWAKTYAAYRYHPEVVFLGSSRTEIGLPTDAAPFAGKRVFNLAIAGASVGDAVGMLRHTGFFHRPEIVIWGLDYGWQFREKTGNTDFDGALVADGPFYPLWRTFLNIKRSSSMAMTADTLSILMGSSEQSCLSLLASYGQKTSRCLEYIMRDEGGTAKAFEEVLKKSEPQAPPPEPTATIALLNRVTADYCRTGTLFRFYLQPIHALAELSYWATEGEALDTWKVALVQMIDERRQQGCDIRLLDFSGFNRITTEEIPQATGRDTMQNFWEQSHYRSEVGHQILEQLMAKDGQNETNSFGRELTGATIEGHLTDYHNRRGQYLENHPHETRNMVP